jgi:hypothetical protein
MIIFFSYRLTEQRSIEEDTQKMKGMGVLCFKNI